MGKRKQGVLVAGGVAAAGAAGAVLRATAKRAAWSPTGEEPQEPLFPPGFRFGAATSAHQVEGGTTNNNWTRWEEHVRPDGRGGIVTGDRCGQASDHWNRFEDDVELMTALGIDIYRFSVEWSRLEPQQGRFDDGVLERYRSWCATLREAGIAPMITLHHFTEPLWLTDRGGGSASSARSPSSSTEPPAATPASSLAGFQETLPVVAPTVAVIARSFPHLSHGQYSKRVGRNWHRDRQLPRLFEMTG
jgi:hypothetical protein